MVGLLLPREAAGDIAEEAFLDLLETGKLPRTWEATLHWLTSRVTPAATAWVAAERVAQSDADFARDPEKAYWAKNPPLNKLVIRSADGALRSREWNMVDPILWSRAVGVFKKFGVGEDDSRDIYMETFTELTAAKQEAGPLESMVVFEELPRFFAVMLERRTISWFRKRSARKRQADNPLLADRLDDPDSPLANMLADPRSLPGRDPWAAVSFDQIHAACRGTLDDFEWHLINALFVEGSHTRLDLACDAWVLEHLGMSMRASESKRRRGINAVLEGALGKLGRALVDADFPTADRLEAMAEEKATAKHNASS